MAEKRADTIIEYAARELRTFDMYAFNRVDSLVLSQLAYMQLGSAKKCTKDDIPKVSDLMHAEYFKKVFDDVFEPHYNRLLLFELCASPRFRDIRILEHVNTTNLAAGKQFSATTFLLPDETAYIAFRGTDFSLAGWKEDFMMAYSREVPSQLEGSEYLSHAAALCDRRPLMVGGHSKGGNIAVYATMKAEPSINKRITRIFSHDGPGFDGDTILCPAFSRITLRIDKTLPQSSLIGMLLQNQEEYRVVNSSNFWVLQHDPFSWKTSEADFDYADDITKNARFTNKTLNEWIACMTHKEREMFVTTLFDALNATGARTFYDFSANWRAYFPIIFKKFGGVDPQDKKMFKSFFKELVSLAAKNLNLPMLGS